MSTTGTSIELHEAEQMAEKILMKIAGEAHIVGSIRRKKRHVGDIEILVHEDAGVNLDISPGPMFGGEFETLKGGPNDTNRGNWKYWQIRHTESGVNVDLFRFNDDNRGSMSIIRTGPAEFSKKFVIALKGKGLCHSNGYIKGGGDDTAIECPSERQAFEMAGMHYIEPENRK